MNASGRVEELRTVSPERLRAYLVARGWVIESTPRPEIELARKQGLEVLIPGRPDWGDYAQRVDDAVQAIAVAEGRPAREVLVELSGADTEALRRLCRDVGLAETEVDFDRAPADVWLQILERAEDQGLLLKLLARALSRSGTSGGLFDHRAMRQAS